jgi:lysophospholipase L1-like esterase
VIKIKALTLINGEKQLSKLDELGISVKDNGAKGDGTTDDKNAIQTTINNANKNVIVPSGDYNITTPLDNKYGKSIIGEGRILKNGILQNSYADKYQHIFGREYLSSFHKKIMNGTSTKIVFSGDSTTSGYAINSSSNLPHSIIAELINRSGISGITTVNNGQSGKTTGDWNTTYVNDDIASNPDVLVLRWGLNDAPLSTYENFVNDLRSGLSKIRAVKSLSSLAIILMSPNATLDPTNNRNNAWEELIIPSIKQAARDYNCLFFDTYALFRDSENGADWMDDFMNEGIHLHPVDVANLWIYGSLFDYLFPTAFRLRYGSVNGSG